jgi:hypothetical protein
MAKKPPWYIEQRGQALAVLLLTDRSDLRIRSGDSSDAGPDLVVEITKDGRPTQRLFGVRLKGVTSSPSEKEASRLLAALPAAPEASEFTFPVCGFLFDVKRNDGFYAWLVEPVVSGDGKPGLEPVADLRAMRLGAAEIDSIVDRVNRWYDALLVLLKGQPKAS